MSELAALQKNLGISFKNRTLLEQALVHSSYLNENVCPGTSSNERLEFLGDAVLGMVIAEKLYQDFPDSNEGMLTMFRADLVQRDVLAQLAQTIGLGDYVCLGKGEEASGGRNRPVNLAGCLEAVIAAIFLDRGIDTARDFVLQLFRAEIVGLACKTAEKDCKSQLQEVVQAKHQKSPTYRVIKVTGPDHDRTFTVEVQVGDTVLGKGSGKSKKLAETKAARAALGKATSIFTE